VECFAQTLTVKLKLEKISVSLRAATWQTDFCTILVEASIKTSLKSRALLLGSAPLIDDGLSSLCDHRRVERVQRQNRRASPLAQPPMGPRACQGPNPRRDGGRVVLVDSLVIFRTDRFKLLGDLWIGDLFSWVESIGWRHEKAGQYADSISPTNNPARIDCQLPTIERTPRPSSAWS
jgi:hypothetical protein